MKEHDKLLEAYVAELRQSKAAAEAWWESLVAQEMARQSDRGAAEAAVQRRWPFGPVSHPWVIATYRKYYLECEQLNKKAAKPADGDASPGGSGWGVEVEAEDEGPILPRVFVVDLLSGEETGDLYEFILSMKYVPIGMEHGEPV